MFWYGELRSYSEQNIHDNILPIISKSIWMNGTKRYQNSEDSHYSEARL